MEAIIIRCEVLHIALQKVYSIDRELLSDSPEYYAFQSSEDPTLLGFTYERDYEITPDDNTGS